ncbi:hypothetical protein MNV49_007695 [Pseudohyphozyma bogoriensis]|nr:hypothetical protein MNV49_007695 [Pseudohyphozyma bogoriensis]
MLVSQEQVSEALGLASVCAAPQLIENYRRGSVEGLALPFLVSWFFGDFTNLLGCLLTHQLPFQTYLATYFMFVDVGLLTQYIYYSRKRPPPVIPPLTTAGRQSYLRHARSEAAVRSKSRKRRSRSHGRVKGSADGMESSEDPMAQSWMSESSTAHSPTSARPANLPTHSRIPSSSASTSGQPPSPSLSFYEPRGRTLHRPHNNKSNSRSPHPAFFVDSSSASHVRRQVFPLEVSVMDTSKDSNSTETGDDDVPLPPKHDPEGEEPYPYPERDWERFIGRASAWICTTLYLTSRLPQIWQNFRRRSVEGLSMLLFIMAFVGNSLYVLSILTHPSMGSPGYLLEATPYLMGSGGTLCFDITIVLQSFLYSEKRKERKERDRRLNGKHGVDAEEAAALLQETLDDEETTDEHTAGRRSRSMSTDPGRSRSSRRPSRSNSTELLSTRHAGSLHESDGLELPDEEAEFEAARARSVSRGPRSRSRTAESSLEFVAEEGESSVTLRG